MTTGDPCTSSGVEATVARLTAARNADELEMAWIDGLRQHRDSADRERILTAAGTRLACLGDLADDHLWMSWLRQVAEEPWLLDSPPPGESLSPLVSKAVRETFARLQDDLGNLRATLGGSKAALEFALSCPAAAAGLRGLGRIVQRLRGKDLLALVNPDDVELVCNFVADLKTHANPLPIVPDSLRVTREHLLDWGRTPAATGDFPRLVRSLIAETAPDVGRIHMPGGSGVACAGWDGLVERTGGNRFVPSGLSAWELSTAQTRTQSKAETDYEKRVTSTPADDRANMTYVAAICAPWAKAATFTKDKSLRREFKRVSALRVDDIEDWLVCAPVTTTWLRERMGKPVSGIMTLAKWWQNWLDATRIPIHSGIVLAGRRAQADTLRDLCPKRRGNTITIGGDIARDEILAFAAATLVDSDASQGLAGDVLYVDEHSALKRLLAAETIASPGSVRNVGQGMTVVAASDEFAKDYPRDSIHTIIVPLPGSNSADIVLKAVDSDAVAQLLQAAGEDFYDVADFSALARMSLLTLRRRLALQPELYRPEWAKKRIDRTLRRGILLNSWDQRCPGDRRIVEQFLGHPHGDALEFLANVSHEPMPPLVLTEEHWHAVAPADTWELLEDHITQEDLEEFGRFVLEVLPVANPLYGLSYTEHLAKLHEGVGERYSKNLRRGIATTLALLGSCPPRLHGGFGPATGAADGIVSRLLRTATDDPDPSTWNSVVEQLPLLVEAAPDVVLMALRRCLSSSHEFTRAMFADTKNDRSGFVSDSLHVSILFALEILAWSPDHFHATVDLLARMADLDPGGELGNRPAKSLATVFCPWHPQTSADSASRIEALDMMRDRYPAVAWDLMLTMLPTTMDTVPINRGPLYRDWKSAEPIITESEWDQTVTTVSSRLVEDAGANPDQLAILVNRIGDLATRGRVELHEKLLGIAQSDPGEDLRRTVWPILRSTVVNHREFNDTHWALPSSELVPFDDLLDHLRPTSPVDTYRWLFDGNILSFEGIPITDHDAFRAALTGAQLEATTKILAESGPATLLELATSVRHPQQVGAALARTGIEHDAPMIEALDSATGHKRIICALGYFDLRFQGFDWGDFNEFIGEYHPSAPVTADLLRAMPRKSKPWRKVQAFGPEVELNYWTQVDQYELWVANDQAEASLVAIRLLEYGRPVPAANILWMQLNGNESNPQCAEVAAACLEKIAQQGRERDRGSISPDSHILESLLSSVDAHREHIGIARVLGIESYYFRTLRQGESFTAPNVYRQMAGDPEYFVATVRLAYRPANSSTHHHGAPSDAERHQAQNAHRLLRGWSEAGISPGLDEAGQLNEQLLDEWVGRARTALREADRADIGDQMIGHALVATPAGVDGEWPSRIVCDLIESLDSDALDTGTHMALFNQRGATCRGPTQGGEQERELAASYETRAKRVSTWPRVAAIFRSLAEAYRSEAAWQDNDAEARRRGLHT